MENDPGGISRQIGMLLPQENAPRERSRVSEGKRRKPIEFWFAAERVEGGPQFVLERRSSGELRAGILGKGWMDDEAFL